MAKATKTSLVAKESSFNVDYKDNKVCPVVPSYSALIDVNMWTKILIKMVSSAE